MRKFLALGLLGVAANTQDVSTTFYGGFGRANQVEGGQQERTSNIQNLQGIQPRNFGGINLQGQAEFVGATSPLILSNTEQVEQGAQQWQGQTQRQRAVGQNGNFGFGNAQGFAFTRDIQQDTTEQVTPQRFTRDIQYQTTDQGAPQRFTRDIQEGQYQQGSPQVFTRDIQYQTTDQGVPQRFTRDVPVQQGDEQVAAQRQQLIQSQDARISSQVRFRTPQGSTEQRTAN